MGKARKTRGTWKTWTAWKSGDDGSLANNGAPPVKPILASSSLVLALLALGPAAAQPVGSADSEALKTAAAEKGAVVSPSGLVFLSLKEGSGANPTPSDVVKVHYRGTLPDGKEFDSSYQRNEPAVFPLNRVIACWTEGVQRIKVGGKAKLTCPAQIAYGSRGAGGVIPPNATLFFEVELLEIAKR